MARFVGRAWIPFLSVALAVLGSIPMFLETVGLQITNDSSSGALVQSLDVSGEYLLLVGTIILYCALLQFSWWFIAHLGLWGLSGETRGTRWMGVILVSMPRTQDALCWMLLGVTLRKHANTKGGAQYWHTRSLLSTILMGSNYLVALILGGVPLAVLLFAVPPEVREEVRPLQTGLGVASASLWWVVAYVCAFVRPAGGWRDRPLRIWDCLIGLSKLESSDLHWRERREARLNGLGRLATLLQLDVQSLGRLTTKSQQAVAESVFGAIMAHREKVVLEEVNSGPLLRQVASSWLSGSWSSLPTSATDHPIEVMASRRRILGLFAIGVIGAGLSAAWAAFAPAETTQVGSFLTAMLTAAALAWFTRSGSKAFSESLVSRVSQIGQ